MKQVMTEIIHVKHFFWKMFFGCRLASAAAAVVRAHETRGKHPWSRNGRKRARAVVAVFYANTCARSTLRSTWRVSVARCLTSASKWHMLLNHSLLSRVLVWHILYFHWALKQYRWNKDLQHRIKIPLIRPNTKQCLLLHRVYRSPNCYS